MEIRDIRAGEIPEIIDVWKVCGLPLKAEGRDRPDRLLKEMGLSHNRFLAAVEDEGIVGTLLVTHDGRKGWINRLGVLPAWRERGIARSLVREAESWLEAEGIGIFAILVEGNNVVSMTVMRKLEYSEFEGVRYFTKRLNEDI